MRSRRISIALLLAIGLSIVLTTGAIAGSWSPPVVIATEVGAGCGGDQCGGVVGLDASRAVVAYVDDNDVVVHRSSDSGRSWSDRVSIPHGRGDVDSLSVAGHDRFVELAWETVPTTAPYIHELRFARSTNFGATFAQPIVLAQVTNGDITGARVAHGPNGVVVVVWRTYWESPSWPRNVYARVSTNDGMSFGTATKVWDGYEYGSSGVAVGDGVIYVAFTSTIVATAAVGVSRSTDNGQTWSDVDWLASAGRDLTYDVALVAEGSEAYLTYDRSSTYYRRTTDSGTTWRSVKHFPRGCGEVDTTLNNGVLRAAYMCGSRVYYSQTKDGVLWSPRHLVASAEASTIGVGWAGRVIVLYKTYEWYGDFVEVRTRAT